MNFNKIKLNDVIKFFAPMIAGYGVSNFLCPMPENAGSEVEARPDPKVFSIVWPILYVLIGLSWVYDSKTVLNNCYTDILYIALIGSLTLWIYYYSDKCGNSKQNSLYTMLFSILIILVILTYTFPNYLLLPLLVWLLFAMLLNFTEINEEAKPAEESQT